MINHWTCWVPYSKTKPSFWESLSIQGLLFRPHTAPAIHRSGSRSIPPTNIEISPTRNVFFHRNKEQKHVTKREDQQNQSKSLYILYPLKSRVGIEKSLSRYCNLGGHRRKRIWANHIITCLYYCYHIYIMINIYRYILDIPSHSWVILSFMPWKSPSHGPRALPRGPGHLSAAPPAHAVPYCWRWPPVARSRWWRWWWKPPRLYIKWK